MLQSVWLSSLLHEAPNPLVAVARSRLRVVDIFISSVALVYAPWPFFRSRSVKSLNLREGLAFSSCPFCYRIIEIWFYRKSMNIDESSWGSRFLRACPVLSWALLCSPGLSCAVLNSPGLSWVPPCSPARRPSIAIINIMPSTKQNKNMKIMCFRLAWALPQKASW